MWPKGGPFKVPHSKYSVQFLIMVKYTLHNAVIKCLVVTLCLLVRSAPWSAVQADSGNPPVLPDTSPTNVERPCVILYYTLYIRWKWSRGKVLTGSVREGGVLVES